MTRQFDVEEAARKWGGAILTVSLASEIDGGRDSARMNACP